MDEYIVVKALENGVNIIGLTSGKDTKFHHTEKLDKGEVFLAQFTDVTTAIKINGAAEIYTKHGKLMSDARSGLPYRQEVYFMWTVIYVSQSIETAKKLIDVLLTNKVISKLRRTNNCNGNESSCYEVLVPSTELETAQDLIFENELF